MFSGTQSESWLKPALEHMYVSVPETVRYDRGVLFVDRPRAFPSRRSCTPLIPQPSGIEGDLSLSLRLVCVRGYIRWYISTCARYGLAVRESSTSLELLAEVRLTCCGTRRSSHRLCVCTCVRVYVCDFAPFVPVPYIKQQAISTGWTPLKALSFESRS